MHQKTPGAGPGAPIPCPAAPQRGRDRGEAYRRGALNPGNRRGHGSLAENHLVDNRQFAAQWAASRAERGLGAWRIAQELRHKGIPRDVSGEALALLDENVLPENAASLADKHLRRGDVNARRRALDALTRRGYGYALAQQAVERAAAAVAEEE